MAVNSLYMLPKFLLDNPTFKDLLQVEDIEMKEFENYILSIKNECNINSCNRVIDRYESIFDVNAKGDKKERIARVLQKVNASRTFHVVDVAQMAEAITGKKADVIEYYKDYCFDVLVHFMFDDKITGIDLLREAIEELRPCHLAFKIVMQLEIIAFKNYINIKEHALNIKVRNPNTVDAYYLNGSKILDGSFKLEVKNKKKSRLKSLNMRTRFLEKETSKTYITIDSMWELNGKEKINGYKKLNAAIRRLEI